MKLRISISGRAETDLTRQYRWYLENAGLDVAERFLAAFDATAAKLATHPGLGGLRNFRAFELAGIRSFPVVGPFGAHLVFYRTGEATLDIERIMHGARDLPRRLLEAQQELNGGCRGPRGAG